jgi:hypothetical protein
MVDVVNNLKENNVDVFASTLSNRSINLKEVKNRKEYIYRNYPKKSLGPIFKKE